MDVCSAKGDEVTVQDCQRKLPLVKLFKRASQVKLQSKPPYVYCQFIQWLKHWTCNSQLLIFTWTWKSLFNNPAGVEVLWLCLFIVARFFSCLPNIVLLPMTWAANIMKVLLIKQHTCPFPLHNFAQSINTITLQLYCYFLSWAISLWCVCVRVCACRSTQLSLQIRQWAWQCLGFMVARRTRTTQARIFTPCLLPRPLIDKYVAIQHQLEVIVNTCSSSPHRMFCLDCIHIFTCIHDHQVYFDSVFWS